MASRITRNCSYPAGTFLSRNSECNTISASYHHVVNGWYAFRFW